MAAWLRDESTDPRSGHARQCGASNRPGAGGAGPGKSVELRIPRSSRCNAFRARAPRGTPPNVVETDPRTWLLIAWAPRPGEGGGGRPNRALRFAGSRDRRAAAARVARAGNTCARPTRHEWRHAETGVIRPTSQANSPNDFGEQRASPQTCADHLPHATEQP